MTGPEIFELRKKLNLKQKQFADLIYVNQSMVSMYENGICQPPRSVMAHIEALAQKASA